MSTGDVLLQGRHIYKSYGQGKKSNLVLEDVNVEIYEGDFTVIMGSSGAGKSTLLHPKNLKQNWRFVLEMRAVRLCSN